MASSVSISGKNKKEMLQSHIDKVQGLANQLKCPVGLLWVHCCNEHDPRKAEKNMKSWIKSVFNQYNIIMAKGKGTKKEIKYELYTNMAAIIREDGYYQYGKGHPLPFGIEIFIKQLFDDDVNVLEVFKNRMTRLGGEGGEKEYAAKLVYALNMLK